MRVRSWFGITALAAFTILADRAEAQTNVVVQSEDDCPSSQAVREALWAIRPDRQWPALVASIRVIDERVRISLGQDETRWRDVPAPADCEERAHRAALVIAVWSAELPAQTIGAPHLSVAIPAPLPATKKWSMAIELGAAGFYGMVGGVTPGAAVEMGILRRDAWWGVRAALAYQSSRSMRVDIGASNHDRTMLGARLMLRRDRQRSFLSGDLGLVGAFTRAYGDGYSKNESASALNIGPTANGRVGVRWGRFRLWAETSVCRWLAKETFRVDPLFAGSSTTATLPSWDVNLGLGSGITFD